jgi:hypothetical protein
VEECGWHGRTIVQGHSGEDNDTCSLAGFGLECEGQSGERLAV